MPYPPGTWNPDWSDFKLTDISIQLPGGPLVVSDIWDDAGVTRITSSALGLSNDSPNCADAASVDVQNPEAATGDLVLSCPNADQLIIDAGLDVTMEIRVLAGGEVVRFMTSITNETGADVTIDQMQNWVNYGGVGLLWDYDGQDDSILTVPVSDGTDRDAELTSVDARWTVHWHPVDAPGGWVVGNDSSPTSGFWNQAIADFYDYRHGSFVIPDGETRRLVVFSVWSPDELIDGGWTGVAGSEAALEASADAIVARIAEIRELSGVYAAGIPDVTEVVNWGPAPVVEEPVEPELAATGATDGLSASLAAVALLGAGALLVAGRRTRAAVGTRA